MLIFANECRSNTLLAGVEENYILYVMLRHIIYVSGHSKMLSGDEGVSCSKIIIKDEKYQPKKSE